MGILGSFLKGALVGAFALGLASWLYSDIIAPVEKAEDKKEEK